MASSAVESRDIADFVPDSSTTFVLGQGMYGRVFGAKLRAGAPSAGGLAPGTPLAIKMMREQKDSRDKEVLNREAEALEALRGHANVARLLCLATSRVHRGGERRLYFVFERAEKADLEKLLRSKASALPRDMARSYARQLCAAVAYCHSKGFMHRDVKPANILVMRDGTLRLGDFGLARRFDQSQRVSAGSKRPREETPVFPRGGGAPLTASNYIVTLYYRSPELLLCCDSYGPEVDDWSVGALLAELFHPLKPRPVMAGADNGGQLARTFSFVGEPVSQRWDWASAERIDRAYPEMEVLRAAREVRASPGYVTLDTVTKVLPHGMDRALRGLLALDPRRRMTTAEALSFFS